MQKTTLKILIAEDEELVRGVFARHLKRMGFMVLAARDGREAFRMYKKEKPDLLVSDINMPKMSGLELLGKIREMDKNLPTIFVSGQWQEGKRKVKDPNVEFLSKPVDWTELCDRLQHTLAV